MYRASLSAQIQSNAEKLRGPCFTVQTDIDPKRTVKSTQELIKISNASTLKSIVAVYRIKMATKKKWHPCPNTYGPDCMFGSLGGKKT